jgi:hypothetical protein
MDIEELRKKTPQELIALSRTIKSKPFALWDQDLLHKIIIVYEEKTAAYETRTGSSNAGDSFVK